MPAPPRGFERLAAVIGEDAAAALCGAKGGRGIYIPTTGTGRLGALLTADQVDRMRDALGAGLRYTVPMGPASRAVATQRRGRELLAKGWSVSAVAREIGMHPASVRRWQRHSGAHR